MVYSDHLDASTATQSSADVPNSESVADGEVRSSETPPPLPDNEQPPCADEGNLWTPGYWAWQAGGYYWIPGAWVQPPRVGVLWTPGYWEYIDTVYVFHRGYWAEHIGYYGGINYGFGYFGVGFTGGRWVNSSFAYNRFVSNVDARVIHNTYSESIHHDAVINRASYNRGPGGTTSIITAQERAVAGEKHFPPTTVQRRFSVQAARTPVAMPHMPVSAYQPQHPAEHRDLETMSKPPMVNAPAIVRSRPPVEPYSNRPHELTRAPPTAHAIKPASARPAFSKAPRVMSLPKR